jgi:predicted XRE-type DNA-binding protein
MDDKLIHGTVARGGRIKQAKLTEAQVREIRTLIKKGGLTQEAIGARFGVRQGTVNNIARGKNWAWLEQA